MYNTYILKSDRIDRYYIGSTEDLKKRIKEHNKGEVRSTKSGIPWKLVYYESFLSRNKAYKRERQIKSYKGGEAFKKLIKK